MHYLVYVRVGLFSGQLIVSLEKQRSSSGPKPLKVPDLGDCRWSIKAKVTKDTKIREMLM